MGSLDGAAFVDGRGALLALGGAESRHGAACATSPPSR